MPFKSISEVRKAPAIRQLICGSESKIPKEVSRGAAMHIMVIDFMPDDEYYSCLTDHARLLQCGIQSLNLQDLLDFP